MFLFVGEATTKDLRLAQSAFDDAHFENTVVFSPKHERVLAAVNDIRTHMANRDDFTGVRAPVNKPNAALPYALFMLTEDLTGALHNKQSICVAVVVADNTSSPCLLFMLSVSGRLTIEPKNGNNSRIQSITTICRPQFVIRAEPNLCTHTRTTPHTHTYRRYLFLNLRACHINIIISRCAAQRTKFMMMSLL